jgi:Protein of unknown function (DUF4058)
MPSPFPGMDPYLEAHWRDVHASLVIYIHDALQESLPPELRARVEERVVLETPEGISPGGLFPDVRVIEFRPQERRAAGTGPAGVATAEPLLVATEAEPLTEGYIQIIDTSSGNRVVTILEVLSPANKTAGNGLEQYRRKQRDLLQSETSLVEIDLVRTGKHVLAVPLAEIPRRHHTPWMVCVRRAWVPGQAAVYPLPIQKRLPTIKVPLRSTDAEAPLDLQALIEQCYRRGRYEGDINYATDPAPPLTGPDAEWADEMLRAAGLRRPRRGKRKGRPGDSA